jgi:hypothetical protein
MAIEVIASAAVIAAARIHEFTREESLEDSIVVILFVRTQTPNAYPRSEENRQTEMGF